MHFAKKVPQPEVADEPVQINVATKKDQENTQDADKTNDDKPGNKAGENDDEQESIDKDDVESQDEPQDAEPTESATRKSSQVSRPPKQVCAANELRGDVAEEVQETENKVD